jgi:hypothetical protein
VTLCEQLKDIVESYFMKHPNVSINGLAMRSGVGASTLRRILNDSIKGDPAPHTVLNILSSVAKEKKLSKLVAMVDGPLGEMLQETFSHFVESETPHTYDQDLNEILRDQMSYFIYKLAANRKGTDKYFVSEMFGSVGLDRLTKLIDLAVVEVNEEGDIHAVQKNFSLDVEVAAGHLPELVKYYKPGTIAKGQNLFYTMSESLNEEGIQKVKTIQKDAIKKIYDVMKSPFYEGEIPFFTLDMSDTFSFESMTGELQ